MATSLLRQWLPLDITLRTPRLRCLAELGAGYLSDMANIVLRVRLLGGDHMDLMYENPDHDDEAALIDHVVEVMSDRSGVLRCRHGDRLVALFSRGVATIEIAPRGAIV